MPKLIYRHRNLLTLGLVILLSLTGCATYYSRQIVLLYDPVSTSRFGGGDLYLVNPELQPPTASGAWAIGNTNNVEGQKIDTLWSGVSPAGMIQSALRHELNKTGYQVIPAKKSPDLSNKVVEITTALVTIDQVSKISQLNATCTVSVSLTIKKNGAPVRKLRYEAKASDLAIRDRDRLAGTMLNTTMQEVMKQAVPDIVGILEQ